MIDSHAHLFFRKFDDDLDDVILRAREAGVEKIINVGIDARTSQESVDLSLRFDGLYATVGVHPTCRTEDTEATFESLRTLAQRNSGPVVAIGEIGLDYYWKDVPPEIQKPRLVRQLDLARELDLPIVIHCRDALDDLFSLLEAELSLPRGVFHCFSGNAEEARRAMALGYHISFAGNVTYPKATKLQEAAREVDVDRFLLETDCPFLPPQPRRGKRNEPAFLKYSRDYLAALKGLSPPELERATTRNAEALFGL